jgi:Spherulation-specific family 4
MTTDTSAAVGTRAGIGAISGIDTCVDTAFAVPAYFHPRTDPGGWARLAALGPALSFAVMNPDSGPGTAVDSAYHPVIRAVCAAGGRLTGYVDTDYGRRPSGAVLRDVAAYRSWYGLTGVFFDQVPSAAHHLAHYRRLVAGARRVGFDFVVMNPGVTPSPGFADLADVLVTFEGEWSAYGDYPVAEWIRGLPRERFCHLIHGAGPEALAAARTRAAANHVGVLYATELTGSNPWAALCAELLDA